MKKCSLRNACVAIQNSAGDDYITSGGGNGKAELDRTCADGYGYKVEGCFPNVYGTGDLESGTGRSPGVQFLSQVPVQSTEVTEGSSISKSCMPRV